MARMSCDNLSGLHSWSAVRSCQQSACTNNLSAAVTPFGIAPYRLSTCCDEKLNSEPPSSWPKTPQQIEAATTGSCHAQVLVELGQGRCPSKSPAGRLETLDQSLTLASPNHCGSWPHTRTACACCARLPAHNTAQRGWCRTSRRHPRLRTLRPPQGIGQRARRQRRPPTKFIILNSKFIIVL